MILRLPTRRIEFPRRPLTMGIVNINDDSFSQDGSLDPRSALAKAGAHAAAGADMIDVGAESARPNRPAIPADDEIARLAPFLRAYPGMIRKVAPRDADQVWPPVLSVNTWRPGVVQAALELGAEFVNDMGALPTPENAALCAGHGAALLIMHSVGLPKEDHRGQTYPAGVLRAVHDFFGEKLSLAASAGLAPEQIVLDPGLEFAKSPGDDLTLLRHLGELRKYGLPVLLPASRKSVIGQMLDLPDPRERDAGTVALVVVGMERGAQIFRVHHVARGRFNQSDPRRDDSGGEG